MRSPVPSASASVNRIAWRDRLDSRAVYWAAVLSVTLLCFAYVVSLPVGISYDGHIYIGLADILGTHRFPADWKPVRSDIRFERRYSHWPSRSVFGHLENKRWRRSWWRPPLDWAASSW